MLLIDLEKRELIKPPSFLPTNTMYLTRMGSVAYGVNTDNSDQDLYGVCIPPRDYIFPPNYIEGFDERNLKFNQWQCHHVNDSSANGGQGCTYDFMIYNIVNYFDLVMENNPNTLDSLFVRREHIMHITKSWEVIRENRKIFLHKGVAKKMKGYAYSQLAKAKNCTEYVQKIRKYEEYYKIPHTLTYKDAVNRNYNVHENDDVHYEYLNLWEEGIRKTKRFESQKIHNTDVKFLYHVFRLVDQAEFILTHWDLDLQETSRVEKMKAIRRGDITYEQIVKDFDEAESRLNSLYITSPLQMWPNKKEIRSLLANCLEHHYGSLSAFLKENNASELAIKEIRQILNKYSL